ncbi:MAG: helix-turn-helix domain-containing protein [Treponema sp.]|jgi:transcriptional regulator with XRE-family HTH domain|nr:helix-turn-helix domain-containing protein [Treponema sp.]
MDEKEICMLLGQAVKRLRCWNKWTQEFLAEKLEISANFLSNIENGKAWVSPKTMSKLALAFKVEPHELFMPEYVLSPIATDILFQYAQETEKSINMVLGELKDKYLGPETADKPRETARNEKP